VRYDYIFLQGVVSKEPTPQLQHNTVTAQKIYFAFEGSAFRSPSATCTARCAMVAIWEEVYSLGGRAGGVGGRGRRRASQREGGGGGGGGYVLGRQAGRPEGRQVGR
jgi:hypothetical protein